MPGEKIDRMAGDVSNPETGSLADLLTRLLNDLLLKVEPHDLAGTTITSGQLVADATGTINVAARAGRKALILVNHGTTDVFCGPSGVSAATGLKLKGIDGQGMVIPTSSALFVVTSAGNQAISYMEVY